jgi:6-phosphogluconate dehydrogenase (decarboxylating)
MDIGITGLGRMGAGMAERWLRDGHCVVAHNRSRGPVDELAAKGAEPAYRVEELVSKLATPRDLDHAAGRSLGRSLAHTARCALVPGDR